MLAFVIIAFLAAFGLVCAVWTVWGFFLPREQGILTYSGPEPVEFARRYLWLREMGFLRCRLVAANPPESMILWLKDRGIDVTFGEISPGTGEKKT